jgi:DedD protein
MPIKNLLRLPFFKSADAGGANATGAPLSPAESIERIRTRAKHRLMGAAVLVLAGVVSFPLLFDTQPRPIAVDIPIDIPDKATVKPLAIPAPVAAPPAAPVVVAQAAPPAPAAAPAPVLVPAPQAARAASVPATGSLSPKEEIISPKSEEKAPKVQASGASPAIKTEAKPGPKPAVKAEVKAEVKPDVKAEAKADDGRKAQALLEGKDLATAAKAAGQPAAPASQTAAESRIVVQVGAFADAAKAQETRLRVEKAGMKTYTQIAETKEGKRIRVRVGPFATRAEADKAAAKIKALDLPAAILTL